MRKYRPENADGTVIVTGDDGFDAIPIRQHGGVMRSYWRPSWRERLAILFGGHVRLGVFGREHPPVSLDTQS